MRPFDLIQFCGSLQNHVDWHKLPSLTGIAPRLIMKKIQSWSSVLMNDEGQLTAEEYFERAVKQDKVWNFAGAIQDFTAALELRPDWLEAYWGRANARHNSRDYEGELSDVEAILRLEPNNERAQGWRESILSRPKTPAEAFNQLLNSIEVIAAKPTMVKSYIFGLDRYAQVIPGGEDEIKNVLDRLMALNPITGHLARGA